ncbi:permease [Candidatus Pacearchaeota archaeon]|nr:permease [Candidatus Pacearchaeota archaeon]
MHEKNLKQSFAKAGKSLWDNLPLIFGIILLVSLINSIIPDSFYLQVFQENFIFDPLVGTIIGSISFGTPITSYIIGGELLKSGVSLLAVTAFLVAWVTVGLVQLPAESIVFGKKFAIYRNLLSFISAIIVALVTILILNLI